MYKHMMLPHDGSELSVKAEKQCIALAKSVGARVTVIYVVPSFRLLVPGGISPTAVITKIEKEHDEEAARMAQKMIEKVKTHAQADGVECAGVVVVGDNPHEEIIKSAKKLSCDLIMMASHGRRGLNGLLLGSETLKVLTHSKIPVLVVR